MAWFLFVRNRVSFGSNKGLVHKLEYWIPSTHLKKASYLKFQCQEAETRGPWDLGAGLIGGHQTNERLCLKNKAEE